VDASWSLLKAATASEREAEGSGSGGGEGREGEAERSGGGSHVWCGACACTSAAGEAQYPRCGIWHITSGNRLNANTLPFC
jgi:hypothetical protein